MSDHTWKLFGGDPRLERLPPAPEWRSFARPHGTPPPKYVSTEAIDRAVNAALYLRRPLLVTGGPGTGKSTLAREVARQLNVERTLKWPINSRSTLLDALYRYDAVGRLRDVSIAAERARNLQLPIPGVPASSVPEGAQIGRYLSLGPLGTALAAPGDSPRRQPMRVLLIDEIDKSDLDLPNDLLDVLEDGAFVIPELQRIAGDEPRVTVRLDRGDRPEDDRAHVFGVEAGEIRVDPARYPFILITSNGERDFSPAFHRRVVRLHLGDLDAERAKTILAAHLATKLTEDSLERMHDLIADLLGGDGQRKHAVDQVMNLAYLLVNGGDAAGADLEELKRVVAAELGES